MKPVGFRGQAVAGVVLRGSDVLLVRSAKRGGVELPGGRIRGLWRNDGEPESDIDALTREIFEETGVSVRGRAVYLGQHAGIDFDCRFYCFASAEGDPRHGDDASAAFYGPVETLRGGTGPSDTSMAELAVRVIMGTVIAPTVPAAAIKRARQAARRGVLESVRRAREIEAAEATARWRAQEKAREAAMDAVLRRTREATERSKAQADAAKASMARMAEIHPVATAERLSSAGNDGRAVLLIRNDAPRDPSLSSRVRSLPARALMALVATMSIGVHPSDEKK